MRTSSAAALALALTCASPLRAEPPEGSASELAWLRERVEALEERVFELEAEDYARAAPARDRERLAQRVRLSGSSRIGYRAGEANAFDDEDAFELSDARFFIDAELARDVRMGETTLFRDAYFAFEWNLIRRGFEFNEVGDMFVDLRGIGGSPLDVQVGRFQIPIGEAYLRYGRGYFDSPFLSDPIGAPWFWDEGVRAFASFRDGRVGFVTSLTDGGDPDVDASKQVTLKLFARPFPWLHMSVSGLRAGRLGAPGRPAKSALWFGEGLAFAFGTMSTVANFDHGVAVPNGPDELDGMVMLSADTILSRGDDLRLWLSYGTIEIDSSGPRLYDRDLRYWVAELLLGGGLLTPGLRPFYLALRGNGVGTYDRDRGYLLEFGYQDTLGYNMSSLDVASIALGWRFTPDLVMRAEYTFRDIDLVRGVPPAMLEAAENGDFFGAEFALRF